MDTNAIRDAVLRRPFEPFVLRMNDGREYKVPHPELLAVSKRLVVVINTDTGGVVSLEPILIASMEPIVRNPAASKANNHSGSNEPS